MKKVIPFFLLLSLLYSCTVEKRHYRNGWFIERIDRTERMLDEYRPVVNTKSDTVISSAATKQDSSVTFTGTEKKPGFVFANEKTNRGDTALKPQKSEQQVSHEPLPKMSYSEATNRMREQGCKPHTLASTVYWFSILAIPLMILTGFGFIMTIIALILSFVAEKRVIESGQCVEENLALIRIGRRVSIATLFVIALLVMLILGLLLYFG